MIRINLGCGSIQPEGWVNIDSFDHGQTDLADARNPWLFGDGAVDGVVANHFLNALDHHEIPGVLAEAHRVLKPGGVLRILVPNLLGAVNAWERGDLAWFPQADLSLDAALCTYTVWFGTHRSVFTPGYLHELLADFDTVLETRAHCAVLCPGWLTELDDREGESLVFEARR